MQAFTLTITISTDGETVVGEVEGIKGKRCSDISALLDKVGEELEHRHTAEWSEPEPVQIQTGPITSTQILGQSW